MSMFSFGSFSFSFQYPSISIKIDRYRRRGVVIPMSIWKSRKTSSESRHGPWTIRNRKTMENPLRSVADSYRVLLSPKSWTLFLWHDIGATHNQPLTTKLLQVYGYLHWIQTRGEGRRTECQALETIRQDHSVQVLPEVVAKSQTLKTSGQSHVI